MRNKLYVILAIVVVLVALIPLYNRNWEVADKNSVDSEERPMVATTMAMTSFAENHFEDIASGDLYGRAESPNQANSQQLSLNKTRKVIYEYSIALNTDSFDDVRRSVQELAAARKGFIESMEVSGTAESKDRRVQFKVRIPAAESDGYFDSVKELGDITYESKTSDDVTKQYQDTEIEIKNLQQAEARYLALYEKAVSIEEMLLLENEINRIRTQIDIKTANLKSYDYRVDFTLFHVFLAEVVEQKPVVHVEPTMWDRAESGFVQTINFLIKLAQDSVVFFVTIAPIGAILLVLCLVVWIFFLIFRKKSKRNAKKGIEKKQ